jgi:hypothetical protein
MTPSFPGIARTEQPVNRPPSPPTIYIPSTFDSQGGLILQPITSLSDASTFDLGLGQPLTRHQIHTITGNQPQTPPGTQWWTYESRRQAQPILPYLYLGPASVARDHAFLRGAGITMLLAARDTRQAQARLLAVGNSARALGMAADYVDVSGRQELISAIPLAVGKINAHLLEREGRGKVLVCCETGNERSAALVAAYVMTMYDADLGQALGFINCSRFCSNFDDEIKFLLRSYGDIIAARRMVWGGRRAENEQPQMMSNPTAKAKAKRGIEDTMDVDDQENETPESDLQRFTGRNLTPFVDSVGDEAMGLGD